MPNENACRRIATFTSAPLTGRPAASLTTMFPRCAWSPWLPVTYHPPQRNLKGVFGLVSTQPSCDTRLLCVST